MVEKTKNSKSSTLTFTPRIAHLAWKNIWRNKIRSGVILGAIIIGLLSGTFLSAFMKGWVIGTVNDDIETQYSHIQIHNKEFIANYDINAYFIRDEIEEKINTNIIDDIHIQTAFRLSLTGMLASPHNALGVTAKGVWVEEEKQVTTVWKHIPEEEGTFLTDDVRNPIVISQKIADKLKVRLKSRIVFTFQDVHGEMQSMAFRVGGIYKTTNGMFDEANVFVRHSDIFEYTGLPLQAVHEAAIMLADIETCSIISPQLKSAFDDMSVQDWGDLNPMLAWYIEIVDLQTTILLGIFLFALSFGIINTMLMAVLERTRELGMLGAIGMSKKNIFSMIMLETVFLTLFGGIIGIILGIVIILSTMKIGVDLSFFMGDLFEDFGFSSMVYPMFDAIMIVRIVALVMLAGILSAIYPAKKALKLKALEAMRQE